MDLSDGNNQIFLLDFSSSHLTSIFSKSVFLISKKSFKFKSRFFIIELILKSPLQEPTLICLEGYLIGKNTV